MKDFSIVIPSYARVGQLQDCLRAIDQLAYPKADFEVIVVDDGSPAPMDAVIDCQAYEINLSVLRQSRAGAATARNKGAQHAAGHYLVFTDDDCEPESEWLAEFGKAFSATPSCLIGGKVINALSDNVYSETSQVLIDYLYDYFPPSNHLSFTTSNNFAVSRKRFLELGGFDAGFPSAGGEDREFCYRWKRAGGSMRFAPSVKIRHHHQLTLSRFCRQHYRYGRGASRFWGRLRQEQGLKLKIEPLSFYGNMIFRPFTMEPLKKAVAMSALLAVSQIANAVGYVHETTIAGVWKKKPEIGHNGP